MAKFIVSIGSKWKEKQHVLQHVGGKARALFELYAQGIPMPTEGFAITTRAYDWFLNENGIHKDVEKLQTLSSKKAAERRIAAIRQAIVKGRLPQAVQEEITEHVQKHPLKQWAVRSSANVEDASSHSWAGQFESFLNVPLCGVEEAVKHCWASVFSDRVLAYAGGAYKLPLIKMAVLVQETVDADVSGVCFTENPLESSEIPVERTMLIEAVFGLGELLMQGKIIPDRYVVEKKSMVILKADVNEQHVALWADKESKSTPRLLPQLANTTKRI